METISPKLKGKGWKFWDGVVEGLSLVAALPLTPFAALYRSFARTRQNSRLDGISQEYLYSRKAVELGAKVPTEFLAVYLKRLHEIRQRYTTTAWASLEEAETGYRLMQLAEEALMAEAEKVARKI